MPVPRGKKLSERHFRANLDPVWSSASLVAFDDNRWEGNKDPTATTTACPPHVNLPLQTNDIKIRLVHSESNAGVVVGYQVLYESLRTTAARDRWKLAAAIHFYHPADFGISSQRYIFVILQILECRL